MIVTFDKSKSSTFNLYNSAFNKEEEILFVDEKNRKIINIENYFLSKKSIISLFYKIYKERKNKYAGLDSN